MNNLVKKLLNLNQLEFGQSAITMERFDIVDVVNSMIYNANILFKQKDVELQYNVQGPIYVWGMFIQLRRYLTITCQMH